MLCPLKEVTELRYNTHMKCKECGAEYQVNPSQPGLPRKYCSQKCSKKNSNRAARQRRKQRKDNYYVYLLMNNGKPWYVGKGYGERVFNSQALHPLPDGTKPPYIKLKENLLEEDAYRYETYYISVFGKQTDGGMLLNHYTSHK